MTAPSPWPLLSAALLPAALLPCLQALAACSGSPATVTDPPAAPHPAAARHDAQAAALAAMTRAVNDGDAARYARLYADDAVITIPGSEPLAGRRAIERHEVELLRQFPGARMAFAELWHAGPTAVVQYAVRGTTTGGRSMGHAGLLFFRFADTGLIAQEHRHLDSLTPMVQLGALPGTPRPLPELAAATRRQVASGSDVEQRNVATVRALLDAITTRDAEAFLARLTDDVVVDELMLPAPFADRAGARAWFDAWTGAVRDQTVEVATILGAGDAVLVELVVRGTLDGRFGPVSATGAPFVVHRAGGLRLRDGKVASATWFMNGKELAAAVGPWPALLRR